MTQSITAFIGAGNMARALIGGLVEAGQDPATLRASDPVEASRAAADALGVATFEDNNRAIEDADVVVVAVKPQVAQAVVSALTLTPRQLIISICAGVTDGHLRAWTSSAQPVVRCMPNTPALLGAGITALSANEHVDATQASLAEGLLSAVGSAVWVEQEAELDAVTAVSGSGPAYFFYLMEAMIESGKALGLSDALATQLTVDTALGAARMARESGETPAQLRINVTSPGGTTEAALRTLDARDSRAAVVDALTAAAERARELAKEL